MNLVYTYDDPINFISDNIDKLKENNPSFSLRSWSKALGLNSASPLIDILKRKKPLKERLVKEIANQFSMDASESMYFQVLCEKKQAKTQKKALLYELLLNDLKPSHEANYKIYRSEDLDIFSHWIYMAILSLAKIPNIELTAKNISSFLKDDIHPDFVDEALLRLFSKGLLYFDQEGKVQRSYDSHKTKTDIKHKSVHSYYSLICDLAKKSINSPLEEREFQCFSFPLSRTKIPLAKEIIRKCRSSLTKLANEASPEEVYQVNLMLFPLTEICQKQDNTNK